MELQGKETPIFNLGEVSVGMLIRVTIQGSPRDQGV